MLVSRAAERRAASIREELRNRTTADLKKVVTPAKETAIVRPKQKTLPTPKMTLSQMGVEFSDKDVSRIQQRYQEISECVDERKGRS